MNNYQYACFKKKECCNLNQNINVVDLIVHCIKNKCGLNELQNLQNNSFVDLFSNFDMDETTKESIINRFEKGMLREVSINELDILANLCNGNVRVRGPATYLIYNSSFLIRITSGSPYISIWELKSY